MVTVPDERAERDVLAERHRVPLDVRRPGPVTGSQTMPRLLTNARARR